MSLPKPTRNTSSTSTERKLNFLKLTEGQHLIRFLTPLDEVKLSYTHWIRNTSLECPGDTCPICKNNQEILMSVDNDWKEAKKIKGFNPYQVRYYANVLDRTPVKVSPASESGFENKRKLDNTWPLVCEESGEFLEGVEPRESNTVKILAGGKTLFNSLEGIDLATLSESGEPFGIQNFDVILMVSGTFRERVTTPVPQVHRNDVLENDAYELYDLDRALISFTPEEITDFINGASLSDIFSARRITAERPAVAQERVEEKFDATEAVVEDTAKAVSDLISG